ncbi:hypothetical protein K2173_021997 [Erythroxylum novogranatense]|uniref:HTH myb-type domain-containing protein n=1 Tax=Erythroxylum novogranatense TaxID=1862640 RepID=A0AAV8T3Q3_9ROSI|nr:hypothetical protein K2173_021997 [Erythroxylum novogranatense]
MGMQNQNMNLVLSTDAKPRLKWTPELHQRFVEGVNQLGGADKATPKSLMRVMGIPGLTLYHLKSHLQKFRLGKSQPSQTSVDNKQEDYEEIQGSGDHFSRGIDDGNRDPINESLQITEAFEMQVEVQRKLHEQIEVQKHLQLRIEAQGKYLQSVLKKAQETLAGCNYSSVGIELAQVELSRLVSMAKTQCPSAPISELTEMEGSSLKNTKGKNLRSTVCSVESSLTSSDSSGRKEETQQKNDVGDTHKVNSAAVELPLMDIHPQGKLFLSGGLSNQVKKRSGSPISDSTCVEQSVAKRLKSGDQLRKPSMLATFDLNRQYPNDIEPS